MGGEGYGPRERSRSSRAGTDPHGKGQMGLEEAAVGLKGKRELAWGRDQGPGPQ